MITENIQYLFWIIWINLIIPWQFFYIRSIINWETKLHLYTSLIFFIVMMIWGIIQFKNWWWIWTWITLTTAILQWIHIILALKYGYSWITKFDTFILILALSCIPIYLISENQYISLILVITIDILAFIPTFRKTISEPFSENLTSWQIWNMKSVLGILALKNINFLTIAYPLILLFVSLFFIVFMLYFREKSIRN